MESVWENQGLTFCRREMKGKGRTGRTSEKYCAVCKMRKRSDGHDEGTHHQRAEKGKV